MNNTHFQPRLRKAIATFALILSGLFSLSATAQDDTDVAIHGYIKIDFIHDFAAVAGDVLNYQHIPLNSSDATDGQTRFHARESRINLKKTINSSLGNITGFIEGDFLDDGGNQLLTNSSGFRIRHAYISTDHWLAGQSWSTFVDVAAYPETVNLGNTTSQSILRQGQLRYSQTLGDFRLHLALENPETDLRAATFTASANSTIRSRDKYPDVIIKTEFKQDWGHLSLQYVHRSLSAIISGNSEPDHAVTSSGHAFGISAKLKIIGQDDLRLYLVSGTGAGRYLQEATHTAADPYLLSAQSAAAVANAINQNLRLHLNHSYGGYMAYRHWWRDDLRSNLIYGVTQVATKQDSGLYAPLPSERYDSIFANLIYQFNKQIDIGAEYSVARREQRQHGLTLHNGDYRRLELSVKYRF